MSMSDLHVVVGLGVSGLSCIDYLKNRGINVAVTDTRMTPPHLNTLVAQHPDVPVALGKLSQSLLNQASTIVLSPGVSLQEPLIAEQVKRGVPVIGDIELFARACTQPVIAITGTNAKSTVTTLVGKMAEASGLETQTGGNLGIPALALMNPAAQVYVLELSSFQLETTYSLQPKVATILNVTPDHMDRYEDLKAYQRAKQRVYHHCETAVCNLDDVLTECEITPERKLHFTINQPKDNVFGLLNIHSENFLAFENQVLLSVKELPIAGLHYQANALAALAIGHAFGLPFASMIKVLREFKGLPHRCQLVRELRGVKYYNDSKGTNVGASIAAILGLGKASSGKLVLIAGGMGKNADFSPLAPVVKEYIRHVVLIGEASDDIARILPAVPTSRAATMEEAVEAASKAALPGDDVLLSPACASFDMFKDYAHRGQVFTAIVEKLQ